MGIHITASFIEKNGGALDEREREREKNYIAFKSAQVFIVHSLRIKLANLLSGF